MAMQNTLVLERIAQNLPAPDLLSLRQTCSLWNDTLIPELAQPYVPFVVRLGQVDKAADYTNLMRSSPHIPFAKYSISVSSNSVSKPSDEFFTVCGTSIRKLEMCWNDIPSDINRIKQIVFELTPELTDLTLLKADSGFPRPTVDPETKETSTFTSSECANNLPKLKLRKLVLMASTGGMSPLSVGYMDLLKGLLVSASGLESLTLDIQGHGKTLQAITMVRDILPQPNKLKSLTLIRLDLSIVRILVELGHRLQLEELSLVIMYNADLDDETSSLINTFLSGQTPKLRKLGLACKLKYQLVDSFPSLRIPRLEHVTALELKTWQEEDGEIEEKIEYEGGRLATVFPSLKSVKWESDNFELPTDYDVYIQQMYHTGVTELILSAPFEGEKFQFLNMMWPSITRLELDRELSFSNFPDDIWTHWPSLVSLRLRNPQNNLDLDGVLTGIPKARFKALNNELSSLPFPKLSPEKIRSLHRKYKTEAGISDLRELREFVLIVDNRIWYHRVPYAITDIGGFFGFAVANPEMQRMVIENVHGKFTHNDSGNKLSVECRQFIRSAFSPYAVIRV